MGDQIITYFSKNAPAGKEWMGFIMINGKRINIIFTASSEDVLKSQMREFWAKDKDTRKANRERRQLSRENRKAREAERKQASSS